MANEDARPSTTSNPPLITDKLDRDEVPTGENSVSRMTGMLSTTVKGHLVAGAGELAGTFLFLLFAFGGLNAVNDAPKVGENTGQSLAADSSKLLFISLTFGFSLAVNAWVFFRVSGGLFNPAVTLGMFLIGSITFVRAVVTFIAQIVGAIAASAVVSGLTPGPLKVQTQLGDGTSIVQGLFIEMFLTTELVFTIFMLAAEKHAANFIAPVGIGLALFVAQLFGTQYTGCSVNPARSFGPDVIVGQFAGYHWIYWLGPALGACLAAAFFKLIKFLEYERVNLESKPAGEASPLPDTDLQAQQKPARMDVAGSDDSGRTQTGDSVEHKSTIDLEAQK